MADISNVDQIDAIFGQIPQLSHVVHLAGDPHIDADWGGDPCGRTTLPERGMSIKRQPFNQILHGDYTEMLKSLPENSTDLDFANPSSTLPVRKGNYAFNSSRFLEASEYPTGYRYSMV